MHTGSQLNVKKHYSALHFRFDKDTECGLIKQLKKKLEQAESRVVVLEAKVKHAEEDSLKKAEEVI